MRRKPILALCTLALTVMIVSPVVIQAYYQPWFAPRVHMKPIVSTHWLNAHLNNPRVVILDVRSNAAYETGHIPGAISINSSLWITNPPFGPDLPWMEVPDDEYLFSLIGSAGITKNSIVVVVGSTSGPFTPVPFGLYSNADITRVAMTLVYAGVRKISILNGGYEVWVSNGYPVTTEEPMITPVTYDGQVKESMFVDRDYVEDRLGKAILVDARDADVYSGIITEPWPPNPTPGHIPGAKNLPTPTLWNVELDEIGSFVVSATYKDIATLREMARDVIGRHKFGWHKSHREIIVYCGVGGYASTVFFVLSEVLGYRNVKVYDGSWQDWTSSGTLPVEPPPLPPLEP